MLIKSTNTYEVHSLFDIPSVVIATIKILVERQDGKDYYIIVRKDRIKKEKE